MDKISECKFLPPEVTCEIGEPLPTVKISRYYNYDVSSA